MNITISIDELRAHEKALSDWTLKRVNHCAAWLHSNTGTPMGFGQRDDRDRFNAMLEKYDKENPIPRLIPPA